MWGEINIAKFTTNNQKEQESKLEFRRLLLPWDCSMEPDPDVGIDLIVQPFEPQKNDDGSIEPSKQIFQVQLKSTSLEEKINGHGKINIDIEHLSMWEQFKTPVMIARYYLDEKCFYYTWIADVKIKRDQKSQIIYLIHVLNESNKEIEKEKILNKLSPLKLNELEFMPDISGSNGVMGFNSIENIRSPEQIVELMRSGYLEEITKKLKVQHQIQKLKESAITDPKNVETRFALVARYIYLDEFELAKQELAILINQFNCIDAKVIFALLAKIRTNINVKEMVKNLNADSFIWYLQGKWTQPFHEQVIFDVTMNGITQQLPGIIEQGIILPIKNITEFNEVNYSFPFSHESENIFSSPILTLEKNQLRIMRSVVDNNYKILHEFSSLYATISFDDKLNIS